MVDIWEETLTDWVFLPQFLLIIIVSSRFLLRSSIILEFFLEHLLELIKGLAKVLIFHIDIGEVEFLFDILLDFLIEKLNFVLVLSKKLRILMIDGIGVLRKVCRVKLIFRQKLLQCILRTSKTLLILELWLSIL